MAPDDDHVKVEECCITFLESFKVNLGKVVILETSLVALNSANTNTYYYIQIIIQYFMYKIVYYSTLLYTLHRHGVA